MYIRKDFLSVLRGNVEDINEISKKCCDLNYLDELINITNTYKLTPNVFELLINDKYGKSNKNIWKKYVDYKKDNTDAINRQIQTIKCIEDILKEEKVLWIKGVPLSILLYNDPYFRKSGDIDFLVEPEKQKKIVKLLEEKGFKKIGIINDELGIRYSVHFHEIQLMSPHNVLIEIKRISGEMDIFDNNNMMSDFWSNTEVIDICGNKFDTLSIIYTLIHLFLSAFSNSVSWHDIGNNGIRDLYEIVKFLQKFEIDYKQLYNISNLYGICSVIKNTLKKIRSIFGKVIPDLAMLIFEKKGSNQHMMDKLYNSFFNYYDMDCVEELFNVSKKTKAYFDAVYRAYYLDDIYFTDNYLSPDILQYNLKYQNERFLLNLYLDSSYFYSDKESVFELKFLCNKEEVINKYGYNFVFCIVFNNEVVKGFLKNEQELKDMQNYEVDIAPELFEIRENKIHIIYYIYFPFLEKEIPKICYNVQLMIHNENDRSQFFARTILCPQKNTLPIYHTEYLNDIII